MTDRQTIETYNAKAKDYQKLVSRDKPDEDLTRFINAIPKAGHVLDLGCGPGNSGAMMVKAGLVVDAIDASFAMVKIAKETFGLDAIQQDFHALCAVGKYHGIWANFSLLHAPKSDMPALLEKIKTALKPEGILHLGMMIGSGERRESLGRFYAYYQTDEINYLLINAGFTPIYLRKGSSTGMSGTEKPFMIVNAHA